MTSNSNRNCKLETENTSNSANRFILFVAGRKHPIVSFGNFSRAERLALVFAGLVNERMEVFDSLKEICYFIEPTDANRPYVH